MAEWTFEQIAEVVKQRAAEMAVGQRPQLAHATPDMGRKIETMVKELDRLWQQDKVVQRRAQTVLTPLLWQAQTGIEPEKLDLGKAVDLLDLVRPGYTPQWSMFLNIAAMSLLASIQLNRGNLTGQQFLASVQLPLTALFIYLSARRFGTPSVFELRQGLAEKLILTDADSVKPSDVRPPLPGFYVQMPPGALEMWNAQTGWHKVSFVGVAEGVSHEGPREGRILASIFWGEPNERSTSPTDDNAQVSFLSLPDDYDGSIEQYESSIRDDAPNGPRVPFVRWEGSEFSFEDGHRLLRKFVVNFCLYLSSPNPDIQPTGSRQVWREVVEKAESARAAGPHARRQVTIGKNFSLWDVGRQVRQLERAMSKDDILVRGHFRPQAHGPRWSLRKIIWVEPFVRRPTGADVEGHEYAVKGVKKNAGRNLANEIASRIKPIIGDSLGQEVANNVAGVFMLGDDTDPVVIVAREVLLQRKRYPKRYRAEHLTDEMIERALLAVEDLTP